MAKAHFLMQGLQKEENHYNELIKLIEMVEAEKIILSTAFLNKRGVFALQDFLVKVADRVSIYVGCRNGITSKQSIADLLAIGIAPYMVDTGSEHFIFHPKAFMAVGKLKALSVVGSANITSGGLLNNIEASSIVEFNLAENDDKIYIDEFNQSFEKLKNDFPDHVFRVNSIEEVNQMFEEGRLVDEEKTYLQVSGTTSGLKKLMPTMKLEQQRLTFPKKEKDNVRQKGIIKNTSNVSKVSNTSSTSNVDNNVKDELIFTNLEPSLQVIWKSKKLVARDLNIKMKGKTHPTGSMLLKKGLYDIDQQTYFRHNAFANLDWQFKEGTKFEFTKAKFGFVIEGIEYPMHELTMKHDTRTDTISYKQKQPMTHLIWGSATSIVSNPNLLGKQLTLYRVKDENDKFIIKITDTIE